MENDDEPFCFTAGECQGFTCQSSLSPEGAGYRIRRSPKRASSFYFAHEKNFFFLIHVHNIFNLIIVFGEEKCYI